MNLRAILCVFCLFLGCNWICNSIFHRQKRKNLNKTKERFKQMFESLNKKLDSIVKILNNNKKEISLVKTNHINCKNLKTMIILKTIKSNWCFKCIRKENWIKIAYINHYPIPNNDLLSFNSCNITWRTRSIFKYTSRAAIEADQEEGSIRLRILPREYTDPYTS